MTAIPRPRARLLLLLAWLAVLALAAWALGRGLRMEEDLRRFLPTPRTPAQVLLVDELGEGPGSRVLLLALSGAPPEMLAAHSQALRDALAAQPEIALAANGDHGGVEAVPAHLRPYRYLLSPTLDTQPLDAAFLRGELEQRVQDLGSPAAGLIEPLLPSDPTLETLRLAELWQPANAPERRHGVWFDRAGAQALLLVQTRAAGFDSAGQQAALAVIRDAFAAAAGDSARMEISVRALLREKGTPYAELGLDDPALSDAQVLDAMMAHPILINRPIVVTPEGVRLCRPSEDVLDLLPPQRGAFVKEDGERVIDEHGRRVATA